MNAPLTKMIIMMNELQEIGYFESPNCRDFENRNEGFEYSTIQKTDTSSESVDAGTKNVSLAENLLVMGVVDYVFPNMIMKTYQ